MGGELSIAKNSGVGNMLIEVCYKNVNANSGNASYPGTIYKSFVRVLVSAWIIDEKTIPCTTKVPITKASTLDVVNYLKEQGY